MLEWVTLVGVWGAAAISVLGAVSSALNARRSLGLQLREDVDEISTVVGQLGKITRSLQMQRVRGAAPEVRAAEAAAEPQTLTKAQLRSMAAQRMMGRSGG